MTDTPRSDPRDNRAVPAPFLPRLASIRSTNIQTLLRQIVFVILLTRSVGDPIFGLLNADLGESTIGFGAVVNALVIIIAALFVVLRSSTVPFAVFAIWAPYLLVVFGAALYAPDFTGAARISLVILSYWAMFALPFFIFRSVADLRGFVLLIFASSIGPSVYAVRELGLGLSNLSDLRLQSTFPHANIFAFYLVLLLGLALYVRTSPAHWSLLARRLTALYIPVLMLFLAFTKTRSAWGSCAVMFLVYGVRFDRRALMGLLVLLVLLSNLPPFGDRVADLMGGEEIESFKELNETNRLNSFAWREALWESAIPSIAERPVLGRGLESFRPSTRQFFPLAGPEGTDPHNLYLQILFEMGVIGIIAYVWLMGSLGWWIKNGFRDDPNGIVVVFSIFITYLLESFSDNMLYYLSFNWYFMFTMGTICAWIEYERSRSESPTLNGTAIKWQGKADGNAC